MATHKRSPCARLKKEGMVSSPQEGANREPAPANQICLQREFIVPKDKTSVVLVVQLYSIPQCRLGSSRMGCQIGTNREAKKLVDTIEKQMFCGMSEVKWHEYGEREARIQELSDELHSLDPAATRPPPHAEESGR